MRLPGSARIAVWLLARSVTTPDRDAMVGDLLEEYRQRARGGGEARAVRWLWGQALRSLPHNLACALRHCRSRKQRERRRRGDAIMTELFSDLRFALRAIGRRPLFFLLVVLALALGIGANVLVYSAVDGIVLHPFPFPEPDRLVGIGPEFPKLRQELRFFEVLSPVELVDIRDQAKSLEDIVAFDLGHRQISGDGAPERVVTTFWLGDGLETLGLPPTLGRGFVPDDFSHGDSVLISHRLWLRRFGGDRSVLGSRLLVNGNPYTLVGVLPPRSLIYGSDLWLPLPVAPEQFPRHRRQFNLIARMAPGFELTQVNAELETIARRVELEHVAELEEYQGWRLVAAPWDEVNVRFLRPVALLLLGAVGFVLLLVWVNVASLLLGHAAARQQETAVRQALGAGRLRLVRQLLTESVLLAAIGGALGVGAAALGARTLGVWLSRFALPVPGQIELSGRVLLMALVTAAATGVLFGLAPALQATRRGLEAGLRRRLEAHRRHRAAPAATSLRRRRSGAGAGAAVRRRAAGQ